MEPTEALHLLREAALSKAEELERAAGVLPSSYLPSSELMKLAFLYREAAEGANFMETLVVSKPTAQTRIVGARVHTTETLLAKIPLWMKDWDQRLSGAIFDAFAERVRDNTDGLDVEILEGEMLVAAFGAEPDESYVSIDIDLSDTLADEE